MLLFILLTSILPHYETLYSLQQHQSNKKYYKLVAYKLINNKLIFKTVETLLFLKAVAQSLIPIYPAKCCPVVPLQSLIKQ